MQCHCGKLGTCQKTMVEWYLTKEKLLVWKYERGLTQTIKHKDIVPLLNGFFQKAFGCEEINKAAIVDQEWNPLNRKLLEHPSTVSNTKDVSSSSDVLPDLNFVDPDGVGASVR